MQLFWYTIQQLFVNRMFRIIIMLKNIILNFCMLTWRFFYKILIYILHWIHYVINNI